MLAAPSSDGRPQRLPLSRKLAIASGAGLAITGLTPQSADAGTMIRASNVPIMPPVSPGQILWDIDGNSTDDFIVQNWTSSALLGELNSNHFVGLSANNFDGAFAKLAAGFTVGANMAPAYRFGAANGTRYVMVTENGNYGSLNANGWGGTQNLITLPVQGYFGFEFTAADGVHYGWGEILITGNTAEIPKGQGFQILDAYYGVAGASIQVGDKGSAPVPEIDPASAGSVLSLVMGSAAMLERRRKRQAAANAAVTA